MRDKKKLVVLTGAGISAESGISTFRDSTGLWEKYRIEEVATPEAWQKNPELVTDFYNQRRRQLLEVKPNRAHEVLVELESDFDVHIITQNVDNLHEQAGSKRVLHLHGELMKVRSTGADAEVFDLKPNEWEVKIGDVCPKGFQLRPHIVWFGEDVPEIENAIQVVHQADVFVVIGTSLQVYPAAGLIRCVSSRVPIFLIDPNEVAVSGARVAVIKEIATRGLEVLVPLLMGVK